MPRRAANLTSVVCEQATRRDRPYELRDAGCRGLRLLVHPSGRKVFILRYRRPGNDPKRRVAANLTLGPFAPGEEPAETPQIGDPLTLESAHTLANEIKRQLKRKVDLGAAHIEEKKRRRTEPSQSDRSTFATAAVAFVKEYARPKTRRWFQTARLLGLDPNSKELTLIENGRSRSKIMRRRMSAMSSTHLART